MGLGVLGFRGLPTEAPRLDPRGSSTARRAEAKAPPQGHPVSSRIGFFFFVLGVHMQTSLNTTQQGSWYRKSASGYHKAGARGKSVEHCFIGPAADWCRVSRLADRELLKAMC